ncbi:MAG: OmpA family protein [Chitinophagaceae bacterium]|nr:OmpA family protein [Chitinophagaceae bacterium]
MIRNYFILVCCILLSFSMTSCKLSKKKQHRYMEGIYKEVKETFPEATIKIINDSIKIIFPNNIIFTTGSAELIPVFYQKLARFSIVLAKYEQTKLLITGHTDNTGEEESNNALSKERSRAVKERLLELKVKDERIFTWGLGQKAPIAENDTDEGRALNRRVEFVILYDN